MRSFIWGMVLCFFIINLCGLIQACGQIPQKRARVVQPDEREIDQSLIEDVGPAAMSEAQLSPALINPQCTFQEEAPQQNITYYGVQEIRSPLLARIGRKGLTKELAVQFALVNNPELFAYYENLEIAYAGLIEAGLRQNPVVSSSARYPDQPDKSVDLTYDTAISFLDHFLIPLRQRAALADFRVIESEVAQKVIDLVKDVEINWLEASILELKFVKKAEFVELKKLATQLADLQQGAGNISALKAQEQGFDLALEQLENTKAEVEVAREKLSRSLGLFGHETCFSLSKEIDWSQDPPLPDLAVMEKAAIENRPDLEALRREIDAIAQEAKLKEWWTYSNIKVGVSAEKDADGLTVVGPSIELEVPVFNYGQGEKIKFDAMLAQAQKNLLARAIAASSEVREFVKTANIHRAQLEMFEKEIFPNLKKQIDVGMAHYNVMTLGVFALFDLKEKEIDGQLEQLDALLHYEKAITELLHAVGGSFASVGSRQ